MNQIPTLQNDDAQLKLLSARRLTYRRATMILVTQVALLVIFPIAAAVYGFADPDSRPLTAFLALTFTFLDILLIDNLYKSFLLQGAKLGEEFDCTVLDLPWETAVAGQMVARESIAEVRSAVFEEKNLKNWYPPAVGSAVHHVARIICQRANVWYDGKLRTTYSYALGILGGTFALGLIVWGIVVQLPLSELVVSVMSPAAPVVVWTAREVTRQRATCRQLVTLRDKAEQLLSKARAEELTRQSARSESRILQNAIFLHRAAAPLILPGLYKLLRNQLEDQMNAGATDMVASLPPTLRET